MSASSSPSGDAFFEGMFRGGDGGEAGEPEREAAGGPEGGDALPESRHAQSAGTEKGVHRRDAPAGGSPVPGEGRQVRCKLMRADGSEWTVTGLSLGPDGLHVDAYRYVSDGRTPAETRRERLDDELLASGDRVWCLNRRGAVVWTLSSPDEDDAVAETGDLTERENG